MTLPETNSHSRWKIDPWKKPPFLGGPIGISFSKGGFQVRNLLFQGWFPDRLGQPDRLNQQSQFLKDLHLTRLREQKNGKKRVDAGRNMGGLPKNNGKPTQIIPY